MSKHDDTSDDPQGQGHRPPLLSEQEYTDLSFKAYERAKPPTDRLSQQRNWEALQARLGHSEAGPQHKKAAKRRAYLGIGAGLLAAAVGLVIFQPVSREAADYDGLKGRATLLPVSLHPLVKNAAGELQEVPVASLQQGQPGKHYYFAVATLQPAFVRMATLSTAATLELSDYRLSLAAGERKLVANGDDAFVYEWEADDQVAAVCALGFINQATMEAASSAALRGQALPSDACVRVKGP